MVRHGFYETDLDLVLDLEYICHLPTLQDSAEASFLNPPRAEIGPKGELFSPRAKDEPQLAHHLSKLGRVFTPWDKQRCEQSR
jgi:hypothetical protein